MKVKEATIPPGRIYEVSYLPEFPGAKSITVQVDTTRDQDNFFQLGFQGETMTVTNFLGWYSATCNKKRLHTYLEEQILNQINTK